MNKMSQRSVSMRPPARVVPPEVSAQRQQDAAKRVAEMTQQRPTIPPPTARPQMAPPPAKPQMAPPPARPQVAPQPVQAPPVSTKPLMASMGSNSTMGGNSMMGGQPMGRGLAGMKKGGMVKKAKGGSVSSASKRADGCAVRGKTKGKMI